MLRYLDDNLQSCEPVLPVLRETQANRFVQVLTDPYVNALHLSLLPEREPPNKRRQHYLQGLINQLEEDGPDSLNSAQKRDLITDPGTLQSLHALFWSRPPANAGLLP